jgi:hypothetical protein
LICVICGLQSAGVSAGGPVPVAYAAAGLGCLYDLVKTGPAEFELLLLHDGSQVGWPCAAEFIH